MAQFSHEVMVIRVSRCTRSLLLVVAFIATLALSATGGRAVPERRPSSASVERERVVLLHGLARSARSMEVLATRLRELDFETHNLDYPSTAHEPEALVRWLDAALSRCCARGTSPLHFVTHSLGGILLRAQLETARPAHLGRVVLIAPPNRGSQIVDSIGGNAIFESILGPTARELGTQPGSFPNRIGPPDYPLGIIAGTRSINPIASALLPGPDDGAVTIESTRLEGATDFILVAANHTFIMREQEVARQVVAFLRSGRFDHGSEQSE